MRRVKKEARGRERRSARMRLRIVTPLSVVVDEDGVLALRAEDASGSFGILPRHADFLTSLAISVVSWESGDGTRHYCAVRRGVLSVTGGREIAIATREAVRGDDLATLGRDGPRPASAPISRRSGPNMSRAPACNSTPSGRSCAIFGPVGVAARGSSHDRAGEPEPEPEEQDPLVQGGPAARRAPQALAARGRSLGCAPARPDRRARLDHRRAAC